MDYSVYLFFVIASSFVPGIFRGVLVAALITLAWGVK